MKEMDHELERYHKNNASLDLTISDLKLKLDGVHKESLVQRKANADLHAVIRQFHHDLHQTAQHIQVRVVVVRACACVSCETSRKAHTL